MTFRFVWPAVFAQEWKQLRHDRNSLKCSYMLNCCLCWMAVAQTTGENTDDHLDVQNVLHFMRRLRAACVSVLWGENLLKGGSAGWTGSLFPCFLFVLFQPHREQTWSLILNCPAMFHSHDVVVTRVNMWHIAIKQQCVTMSRRQVSDLLQ